MSKIKLDEEELRSFQRYLVQCNNILVLIGSGLSAASGIETYQNTSGYWKGFHSIDLSTPDAFIENPGLVWQFYSWRRKKALKAKPNKGHFAIAELSKRLNNNNQSSRKHCFTINQNVDGLNIRAGHDKQNLLELHGSLYSLKCTDFFCNYRESNNFRDPLTNALKASYNDITAESKESSTSEDNEDSSESRKKKRKVDNESKSQVNLELLKEDLPKCPMCGGLLRPGVVWFGESIPLKIIDRIDDLFMQNKIDLVLVVGTSGTIWPAVGYVERVKLQGGKIAIFNTDINFEEIEKDAGNCWGFEGDASQTLPVALEPIIGRNYLPRDYRKR